MRVHFHHILVLFLLGQAIACSEAPYRARTIGEDSQDSQDSLVVLAELGNAARDDPLAVLAAPIDAIFLDDEILVLDSRPPWVRVYDRHGRFVRWMIAEGTGLGEVIAPRSIAPISGDGFLITSPLGVSGFDRSGKELFRSPTDTIKIRGASWTCDDKILVAVETLPKELRPFRDSARLPRNMVLTQTGFGVLGLVEPSKSIDETAIDTVTTLRPLRLDRRRRHPWLALIEPDGTVLFPEEADESRVLRVTCETAEVSSISVAPLGEGEVLTLGDSTFRFRAARPPLPAGFIRVGENVLWATAAISQSGVRVTAISTLSNEHPEDPPLVVDGWLTFVGSASDGAVLAVSGREVVILDGNRIVELLQLSGETGTESAASVNVSNTH